MPYVRDAFAAGLGAWTKCLLEAIVCALKRSGDFSGDGETALQWWIFVKANFPVICEDFNAFVAAARQWDVHGIVYQSMFGRGKDTLTESGGTTGLAEVVAAAASAAVKPFSGTASTPLSYLQYPLRHIFPSVSFHQRCRFSFAREASRLSVFRCASHLCFISAV